MHDVTGVKEVDRTEQVVKDCDNMHFLQLEVISILYQMSKVLFDVVHDKHDAVLVSQRPSSPLILVNARHDDIKQLSCKHILRNGCEFAHNLYLGYKLSPLISALANSLQYLDSNLSTRHSMPCFEHLAEVALSEDAEAIVVGREFRALVGGERAGRAARGVVQMYWATMRVTRDTAAD